jgi:GAF domain-containing protein/HAMP domain-containing protein
MELTLMSDKKPTSNGSVRASRHVFRLSPSLNFPRDARKTSLFFTLRARLIVSFLLVALATTALFAYFDARTTQNILTDAANQALYSAARQTKDTVDSFIKTHVYAINEDAGSTNLVSILALPEEEQTGGPQEELALSQLNGFYAKDYSLNNYIFAYVLLNKSGKVLLDTSTTHPDQSAPFLNLNNLDPSLFSLMLSSDRPYVSSIIFPPYSPAPVFYFISRVKNENRQTLGFLAARYNAAILQSFIDQNQALAGSQSYAVLYDNNLMRLAEGLHTEFMYQTVVPLDAAMLANLQKIGRLPSGNGLSTNISALASGLSQVDVTPYFTTQAAGAGAEINAAAGLRLENKDWSVAYLQPRTVFLAPLRTQIRDTILIALAITAVASLFGLLITRRLTTPIEGLTRTAEKVAAGDLWAEAPESQDEIGMLASAFNTMTTELRRTLESLEQRIADRTSQLARASEQMKHRANQLLTVTEVAHAVASIQDPEKLLPLITQLISERFGFYHVGIFLVDTYGEYAILQAANSVGGQRMLKRQHKLKVGQIGIVGYVTGSGEPRIALDVGADAVFFDNPDLPDTRSEMALPLKIGETVIGALDVQSEKPSAFIEEDIAILSTLADQVAIAIENARLFSQTRNALTELQTLHGQYLQQQWSQAVIEAGKSGYQYINGRLEPIPTGQNAQLWKDAAKGASSLVITPTDGQDGLSSLSNLIAPITVHGEVIGVYNLGESGHAGGWNKEDIDLVKAVADQVGLALENARLLEQTQKRAESEHLVAEITSKLRASNDPKMIIETAKRELLQALHAKRAEIVQSAAAPAVQPMHNPPEDNHKDEHLSGNEAASEPDIRGEL